MKNITVSVDEDLYHLARVKAAEKRSSVSRLVAEFLEQLVNEEKPYQQAREEMACLFEKNTGGPYVKKVTREEMYEGE